MGRVLESLRERGIELKTTSASKIVALSADFSKVDFDLGGEMMEQFRNEVSLILHVAWPVNFAINLQSFEPHLAGLKNLLDLSLAVKRSEPARFFFASSISTAENTPAPALIRDAPIEDLSCALDMGYAQSKLVGEYMVLNAARNGARSYILRIGQIVGDRQNGVWNDSEFVPSMIRSALSMKALPDLHETCSWIPVDTLASAILELDRTLKSGPKPCAVDTITPPVVYNMTNPHWFSWDDLLEELHKTSLEFKVVPVGDWLQLLRDSAASGNEKENPAVKLLDHFELRYGSTDSATVDSSKANGSKSNGTTTKVMKANAGDINGSSVNGSGVDNTTTKAAKANRSKTNGAYVNGSGTNGDSAPHPEFTGIMFDTKAILQDTAILRQPPNIIEDGYVQKFMSYWLSKWVHR